MRLHRDAPGRDRFRIVTGTAFGNHDLGWIRSHAPDDGSVEVADVTSAGRAWACGARGPATSSSRSRSRPLERRPPYMTAREIAVGNVPARGPVTYVGELGWELYCPAEYGPGCGICCGGRAGARDAGVRLPRHRRAAGREGLPGVGRRITPEDSPDEAGLGFAVKPDKGGGFLGRTALIAARNGTPERRLACLALADPRAVCLGQEPVRVGGEVAGRVTSGGYGFAVEQSIAYAYVPTAAAEVGTGVEVEVFGEWVAAGSPPSRCGFQGRADPLVGLRPRAGARAPRSSGRGGRRCRRSRSGRRPRTRPARGGGLAGAGRPA